MNRLPGRDRVQTATAPLLNFRGQSSPAGEAAPDRAEQPDIACGQSVGWPDAARQHVLDRPFPEPVLAGGDFSNLVVADGFQHCKVEPPRGDRGELARLPPGEAACASAVNGVPARATG